MVQTAYDVNGHLVANDTHSFRCLNCGAKLLTLMQYNTASCPKDRTNSGVR